MLEFNQDHKKADLSSVKSKLEKAKIAGTVMLGGIFIAGCIMFGNYIGNQAFPNNENGDVPVNYSAVVEKDDQAMVVDLNYYTQRLNGNPFVKSDQYTLVTPDGDRIVTQKDAVVIFDGDDAHEKAESYAQEKYDEVIQFEEVQSQGLSRL